MAYTGEEVEKFAATLDALPAVDKSNRTYNKKETVRLIEKRITAARTRGYSLEQIVESLRGKGFDIANSTLRNYMSQNQRPVKKAPARQKSAPQTPVAPDPEESGEDYFDNHEIDGKV